MMSSGTGTPNNHMSAQPTLPDSARRLEMIRMDPISQLALGQADINGPWQAKSF